jgi:hypothetical protein
MVVGLDDVERERKEVQKKSKQGTSKEKEGIQRASKLHKPRIKKKQ